MSDIVVKKQITDVDVVSTLNDTDNLFINQGSTIKQIKASALLNEQVDATLTSDTKAAPANIVGELKSDFSNLAPVGAAVGQLFRVAAISEDGKYTMEPVDMPSGDVKDVQIDGKSIVQDGVAEIPTIKRGKFGLPFIDAKESDRETNGIDVDDRFGNIKVIPAKLFRIDGRSTNTVITPNNFDYAVKCAMCDGKGEAWTAEEQDAARARMGIGRYEILNLTLDERLEGSASAKFFTTSVTSDGIELSSLNIRRLLFRIKYPSSDEYTGNNMRISFNDTGASCATIYIASDSVVCSEIEVIDRYNIYHPLSKPALSYNSAYYELSGAYLYDNLDKLGNDRNQIESIQFYANYPNGTVLPVGTEIKIIGIAY